MIVEEHSGGSTVYSLSLRLSLLAHNQQPYGEHSLGFGDRYSNLDGGSTLDPVEPRLETREFIKTLDPGEFVTSNPVPPS